MRDTSNIKPPVGDIQHKPSLIEASVLVVLICAFSIELYSFAKAQDVWIDESTQLSGITAKFWDMLHWLSGRDLDRFGVPGDRMPPISYVLDWLWLRLFGPSELGIRLFHSAFVVTGASILAVITLRRMGIAAATMTLLFLVLSPKLIQVGVEIRSYPIFFSITCMQAAVFALLAPSNSKMIDTKVLAIFGTLCLIAVYNHFYGMVSTCAFFSALGFAYFRSLKSLTALAVVFAAVAIGSLGLIPFLTNAVDLSAQTTMKQPTANQYLIYLLRLFGDSANMVLLPAAVAFLGGTMTLLVSGAVGAYIRMARRQARSFDWLYIVVIAGATIPVLASLVITRFNATSPSYSGWLFAPLALLVGASATSSTGFRLWDNVGRFAAIGTTIAGALVSTVFFLAHASMFVHGPERFVGAIFDKMESPTAVVYEDGAMWGYSYFPLVFSHHGKIDQYRAVDGQIQLIGTRAGRKQTDGLTHQGFATDDAPYNHLLVVNIQLRTYRDLRACDGLGGSCPGFIRSSVEEKLVASGQWRQAQVDRRFGLYDTQVIVLDRISASCDAAPCQWIH